MTIQVKQKRKSPPPFSEEHRKRIGVYWKGRKRSDETIIKMCIAQKKRVRTPEELEKFSKRFKGKHHTEEAKRKISASEIGEKNIFWKGGKMKNYSEYEQIRKSIEYKLWRDACFARDGYTCQNDGSKKDVIVHHIHNFADFPELRVSIDNGVTLCTDCHKKFHKKYGKNKNTLSQFEEFINNKNI